MESSFKTATATATPLGAKSAFNAAVSCKATALEFSLTFPPWLVEDLDVLGYPPALEVRCIVIPLRTLSYSSYSDCLCEFVFAILGCNRILHTWSTCGDDCGSL